MATNQTRFVKSLFGPHITEPLIIPGSVQAGATQAIKRGELLELTGDTNTKWVPMDSDFAMAENVAIAACEIKSGDPAGYYPIIAPRPGDVFEFALDAADDLALGTPVYYSSSEAVTDTAGTNIVGNVAGWTHYSAIYPQNFAESGAPAKGTTIGTQSRVHITIENTNSIFHAIQGQ
jgi:predicted RecA/RadA family phage recombinase